MTDHRPDTWATRRKFNPKAAAPPDLQGKPKRRPRSRTKRQQLLDAALAELLAYRRTVDQFAAEVVKQQPQPPQKPEPS